MGAQDRAVRGRPRLPRLDAPGLGNEQRVPQVARRVVGRDVEELEVVLLGLDLWALEHLEAVGVEDLAQVAHHRLHRMQVPDRQRPARRAHVDRLGRQPRLEVAVLELAEPSLDRRVELRRSSFASWPIAGRSAAGTEPSCAQERGQASRSSEQVVSQPIHGLAASEADAQCVPGLRADALEVVCQRHRRTPAARIKTAFARHEGRAVVPSCCANEA